MTESLEFLVFNERARVQIGKNARQRGYEMSWPNVSRELIQYIGPLIESRFGIKSTPIVVRSDTEAKEEPKKE